MQYDLSSTGSVLAAVATNSSKASFMKTQTCFCRCASRLRYVLVLGVAATLAGTNALLAAQPGKGKGNGNDNGNGKGNGKAVGQSADFIPPGHRRAPVEVEVKAAPPALRVEVQSARPSAAHVWVPGFWTWQANAYVWTTSVWMLPPAPAAVWVQPRYEPRASINVFISGYWRI
jgi:hypothetical protein